MRYDDDNDDDDNNDDNKDIHWKSEYISSVFTY